MTLSRPSDPRVLLALLTGINFLNYVDRQILFAVFPAVQRDLGLRDSELGLVASAFIVVYMFVGPAAGWLGDRFRRLGISALAVALWSAATAATAFARSFGALLAARAAVGIGESTYAPAASSLIADAFPPERRGSMLAAFNLAVPVGSALGYVLGGLLEERFGWRAAFLAVGLPGLGLAGICLALREPNRGERDAGGGAASYSSLFRDPVYAAGTAAMAALTFALGALAAWMPTFLVRYHGLSIGAAGAAFGAATAATGIVGTALGGWLGDRALTRDPGGYFAVSATGLLIAVPVTIVAIVAEAPVLFWSATILAEILVFLNTGPLNAVIVNAGAPSVRAMAVGANVLAIHLFGDALSPWLVGALSDRAGLRLALLVVPPVLLAAGLLCLVGARLRRRQAGAAS